MAASDWGSEPDDEPGDVFALEHFALARIAEDEADAEQMARDLDRWDRERELSGADGTQGSIVASTMRGGAFDPARVLAECEAKRRIVEAALRADELASHSFTYEHGRSVGLDDAVMLIASVYADHPDYRPEWRH